MTTEHTLLVRNLDTIELGDDEGAAHPRVTTRVKRNDMEMHIPPIRHLPQVHQLVVHGLPAAHPPPQDVLVHDEDTHRRLTLVEDRLPLHPSADQFLDVEWRCSIKL